MICFTDGVVVNLLSLFLLLHTTNAFPASHSVKNFYATTATGLESILAREIEKLPNVKRLEVKKCGVSFTGTTRTGVEALLWLRTPLKLMELVSKRSNIEDKHQMYSWVSSIDWLNVITAENSLKCDTVLGQQNPADLSHSHFTALTVKNAIVDQFRDRSRDSLRPSVDLDDPDLPLLLYLHRGCGSLYRVWSGDSSMHKRGYRPDVTHKAALRETTAAAL